MKEIKLSNEITEDRNMENSEHFGKLTPRMNEFREAVLEKNHLYQCSKGFACTEAYQLHQNSQPL